MQVSFIFDPLQELLLIHEHLRDALERLMETSFSSDRDGNHWVPAADVMKTRDEFIIDVELPGVSREMIQLQVEGHDLVLSGARTGGAEVKEGRFRRMEGEYGEFKRTFQVPSSADLDSVEASLSSGVLRIKVPLHAAGK